MLGQEGQHRVHIRSNSVPEWPHARDCRTCHTRKPVRFVQPASPMPVGLECLESVEAVAPLLCKCSTLQIFAKVVGLERVWGTHCLVEQQVCLTGCGIPFRKSGKQFAKTCQTVKSCGPGMQLFERSKNLIQVNLCGETHNM
jgi:hypothetical protein